MSAPSRRVLMRTSVLAVPAALLACTAVQRQAIQTVSTQAVTDVGLIANALDAALPSLSTATGLDAAATAAVAAQVKDIIARAAGFVSTATVVAGQSIVVQIGTDFGSLTAALSGVALPADLQAVLNAVQALLPVIELAVGLAGQAAAAPLAGSTSIAQARATLADAAAK